MEITDYRFSITREPLVKPFAFKGGSFTEKWITITSLAAEDGSSATAIGGLAVLWSDARIFAEHSEVGGNIVMSAIAERAARSVVGRDIGARTPLELQDEIIDEVSEYAAHVAGRKDIRRTFVLNSLVSLDLALWKLFAAVRGLTTFDEVIPQRYRAALCERHDSVAHIPLVSYGIDTSELAAMADRGTFLFKIKLGQKGSQREMLEKDKARISEIHSAVGGRVSRQSASGTVRYYLDANGRYERKETLQALIAHVEAIGALDRVVLLEEPFPVDTQLDVRDLPLRVAGDESVESEADVRRLAEQGYGAIAVKPAGKSLSATLRAAETAREHGLSSFVADSACVPQLVDWNKNVAARLPALPGVGYGMLESNGADHYKNWQSMLAAHPCRGAGWLLPEEGLYHLDERFYELSGCVLGSCGRYEALLPPWPGGSTA